MKKHELETGKGGYHFGIEIPAEAYEKINENFDEVHDRLDEIEGETTELTLQTISAALGYEPADANDVASNTNEIVTIPAFTSDYENVLTIATYESITPPSADGSKAISRLINKLKEYGFWDITETANIYGLGSIQFGSLNLKDPATYRHTFPDVSSLLYGDLGVKSNLSINSYINTQYAVTQRSGIESSFTTIIYVAEDNDIGDGTKVYGSRCGISGGASQKTLIPFNSGGSFFGSRLSYDNSSSSFPNTNHKGLYITTSNGTVETTYKDYESAAIGMKHSRSLSSVAPTLSNKEFLLAYNGSTNGGVTPESHYNNFVSCLIRLNTTVTDAQAAAIKAIWDDFKIQTGLS